jgi:hypothetical protein
MTTTAEPEFVAETLAWCNEMRAQDGLGPLDCLPKGLRNDPLSCPCGKATGLYVEHESFGPTRETKYTNDLPDPVIRFVAAFDDGHLPRYDEDAVEVGR